jgi:CHAD domain-containing protein
LRLENLRDALGAALQSSGKEMDSIHKLRTACRRTDAAFQLFEECVPKNIFKNSKQVLREYRRTVGKARDSDVWISWLVKRFNKSQSQGLDFLIGYSFAQRIPAQLRLIQIGEGYPFDYEKWMNEVLSSLKSPGKELRDLASISKSKVVPAFGDLWNQILTGTQDLNEMHESRIQLKKIRYSLEIVSDCIREDQAEVLFDSLENGQEILGDMNDAHNAIQDLTNVAEHLRDFHSYHADPCQQIIGQLIQEKRGIVAESASKFDQWKSEAIIARLDQLVPSIYVQSEQAETSAVNNIATEYQVEIKAAFAV